MAAGAADAWLTPILMKKGRPAHTLSVLCATERRAALRDLVHAHATTFGVREYRVERRSLGRARVPVVVAGETVRIKISLEDEGRIAHATPEFDDVRHVADTLGIPERQVLAEAVGAASMAGLVRGAEPPTL